MNKWLYLMSTCIFLFALMFSFPIVKLEFSGLNMYIYIGFIICFLLSGYGFYNKIFHKTKKEKNIEQEFTPIE